MGTQVNDDLKSIKYFADSIITPTAMPPVPVNTPKTFVSLSKEYFKYEHHRHKGCCKLTWGKKLSIWCSRRTQLFQLVSDNAKKHKNCLDNVQPLYLSAKDLDKKIGSCSIKNGRMQNVVVKILRHS